MTAHRKAERIGGEKAMNRSESEVVYCESCGATTARNGVCADCRDAEEEMSEQEIQSRNEAGW